MSTAPRWSVLIIAILFLGLAQCGQDATENYASGVNSFDNGYYEVALDYLTQAVDSGDLPDDVQARAFNYRGIANYKLDMFHQAQSDYENSIFLDAAFHCPHSNLGDLYVSLQRFDLAGDSYSRALELYPLLPYALYNRHIIRLIQHDYAGAFQDFTEATAMDPTLGVIFRPDNRAFILAADCHLAVPELDQALARAQDATERGDPAKVRELLEPLAQDPGLPRAQAAQALTLLARATLDQTYYAQARDFCTQALAHETDPARRAELVFLQGRIALGLGDLDLARERFAQLESEPQALSFDLRSRMAWGDHWRKTQAWDQAAEEYDSVVQDFPDSEAAQEATGSLLLSLVPQGRYQDALAMGQYLFNRWPESLFERPETLLAAADAYAALGDLPQATDAYAALFNMDPTSIAATQAMDSLAAMLGATDMADRAASLGQALAEARDAPDLASSMIDHQDMILLDPGPFLIPLVHETIQAEIQGETQGNIGGWLVLRVVLRVEDELSLWDLEANLTSLRNGMWEYLSHEDPEQLASFSADVQASLVEVLNERLEYGRCQGAQLTRYAVF